MSWQVILKADICYDCNEEFGQMHRLMVAQGYCRNYDPNDPVQAKQAAKLYIAHQLKTGLNWDMAIASYNAGRTGARAGKGDKYSGKVNLVFEAMFNEKQGGRA